MDLGGNYFLLLGQYLLEFVVALVLLGGLYLLTRRWISKELLARAFHWGMRWIGPIYRNEPLSDLKTALV